MKNKIILISLFLLIFLAGAGLSAQFTPQGDINLREVFDVLNIKNLNQTGNATFTGNFVNITGTLYTFAQKITGNINATGYNVTADFVDANSTWDNLYDYPVACPADTYLTQLGDSVTCTSISDDYLLNTGDTSTGDLILQDSELHLRDDDNNQVWKFMQSTGGNIFNIVSPQAANIFQLNRDTKLATFGGGLDVGGDVDLGTGNITNIGYNCFDESCTQYLRYNGTCIVSSNDGEASCI